MDQDTTPSEQARYIERLRGQSPVDRLRAAGALTKAVRRLAWAGLRHRHPEEPDEWLRVRFVLQTYGEDAARRLFNDHPLLRR